MPQEISKEVFEHMVDLAALELEEEEAEYLRGELNNQLKAIEELAAIPLEIDTSVTSHGVPYTPAISSEIREDEWLPYPDPGEIIDQAPDSDDGYIVVPDIPHEDLE